MKRCSVDERQCSVDEQHFLIDQMPSNLIDVNVIDSAVIKEAIFWQESDGLAN